MPKRGPTSGAKIAGTTIGKPKTMAPAGEARHNAHDQHQLQRDEAEVAPTEGAGDGNLLRTGMLVGFFLRVVTRAPQRAQKMAAPARGSPQCVQRCVML